VKCYFSYMKMVTSEFEYSVENQGSKLHIQSYVELTLLDNTSIYGCKCKHHWLLFLCYLLHYDLSIEQSHVIIGFHGWKLGKFWLRWKLSFFLVDSSYHTSVRSKSIITFFFIIMDLQSQILPTIITHYVFTLCFFNLFLIIH